MRINHVIKTDQWRSARRSASLRILSCPLKHSSGKLIVGKQHIKDMLKQYIAQLMNKENEWNQDILREIKEVLADCIKVGEVTKALEKMIKRNAPAPGLSVVVTEMLQAAGETGVDWLTELCNCNENISNAPPKSRPTVHYIVHKCLFIGAQ